MEGTGDVGRIRRAASAREMPEGIFSPPDLAISRKKSENLLNFPAPCDDSPIFSPSPHKKIPDAQIFLAGWGLARQYHRQL